MKTTVTGIRIQQYEPPGGGGGTGTGPTPPRPPEPENVDKWQDPPERGEDGKPEEDKEEIFKKLETPGGGGKKPSTNPGEILRAGELGDTGGDSGLNGEALAEQWDDIARTSANESGNIPAALKRVLDKLRKPVIDWKAELEKFIDDAISKSKYTLPNRRFLGSGTAQYGYKRYKEDFENIVVAIDTSGSINRQMIEQFLSEVMSITEAYTPKKTVILYCDTQVYEPDILEPGDKPDLEKIAGGGGTNFWPPFKWVDKNLIEGEGQTPTIFIYFTDGYAEFPNPKDYGISSYEHRCIWVFVTFNDEPYPNPHPFGERIDIVLANKNEKRLPTPGKSSGGGF